MQETRVTKQKSSPVPQQPDGGEYVLKVSGLKTHFRTMDGIVKAVDGVDFGIRPGQTLGIVGESGCGKSVTSLSVMRLVESPGWIAGGSIEYRGRNLLELGDEEMRDIRGNDIAMIFQEPMTSLNPVYTVGDQVAEPLRAHKGLSRKDALERAVDLFRLVGIPSPERRVNDYPHNMSGGMRQRVVIAMALSCDPDILIADEPTTALDVTIQAQILDLMRELKKKRNSAVMLITHDLGVVAEMCDYVVVMYTGKVVEEGDVVSVLKNPKHPYTQGLLNSIPTTMKKGERLHVIPGAVPNPLNLPHGCSFAPRCPHRFAKCSDDPILKQVADDGQRAACWLY